MTDSTSLPSFVLLYDSKSSTENMTTNISTNSNSITVDIQTPCDPKNPWCGKSGAQQIVEIIFLISVTILGTFGNILVIASVSLEKNIHKNANVFIINLAVADFLVAGIYTPTVIVNVVHGGNGLSSLACQAFGFMIIVACTNSMWNLALIALNRYVAITRGKNDYCRWFSKRKMYLWVAFTWLWSLSLGSSAYLGWSKIEYEYNGMLCTWSDKSLSYTVFIVVAALITPLSATVFAYFKLYRYVRYLNKISRKVLLANKTESHRAAKKESLKREVSLLKTLAVAVVAFLICWAPYGFITIFFRQTTKPIVRKIFTWLAILNSVLNFIIYGVMNHRYREGYKRLCYYLLCKRKFFLKTLSLSCIRRKRQKYVIAKKPNKFICRCPNHIEAAMIRHHYLPLLCFSMNLSPQISLIKDNFDSGSSSSEKPQRRHSVDSKPIPKKLLKKQLSWA